jgi:3-oxoacyl-[acyl-carrier-protein] synthase-1
MTDGYGLSARWLRLLLGALTDATRGGTNLGDARSSLFVCLPSADAARFEDGLNEPSWFKQRLQAFWKSPLPSTNVTMKGATGFWNSLAEACLGVDTQRLVSAVVLVADSLLDAQSLEWLAEADRLKTPEQPLGLVPGEAAACLVFQRTGKITLTGTTHLTNADKDARQGGAKALASALQNALRSSQRPVVGTIGNHNGEEARAFAWGTAQATLLARGLRLGGKSRYPASSIGDVGICAPAIGIAIAVAAYQRKWAGSGATAVWSLDAGTAGACLVDSMGG